MGRQTGLEAGLDALLLALLLLELQTVAPLQPALGGHVVGVGLAELFEERGDARDRHRAALGRLVVAVRQVAQRRTRREERQQVWGQLVGHCRGGRVAGRRPSGDGGDGNGDGG